MTRSPIEQRLSDGLTRLADYAVTTPRERPATAELIPVPASRERRTLMSAAAGVVVVVLVAGAVGFVERDGHGRSPLGKLPRPTRTADAGSLSGLLAPGAVRILPPAPIAGRADSSAVWDGTDMLIWGGDSPTGNAESTAHGDGAAYNPRTNQWRTLPPSPIAARSNASTVWTGTEMIVWGGTDGDHVFGDGAAYNPTTNRWRTIAAAPIPAATTTATVWTGDEMIIAGGLTPPSASSVQAATQLALPGGSLEGGDRQAAAYNPTTDTWRKLPDAPGAVNPPYPQALWTGSQAIFLLAGNDALAPGSKPPLKITDSSVLTAYDPTTNQWTTLTTVREPGWYLWTGQQLVDVAASGINTGAGVFDVATRTWSRTVSPPPEVGEIGNAPVWTGTQAIFWAGGDRGLSYTPATNAWQHYDAGNLRARVNGTAVWANGLLITWGGLEDRSNPAAANNDGVLYRPR